MISEKLKQLRTLSGLSQRELAKKIGVSCSTVAMIESGKREGSKEVINKIASFFDVSLDYLYGLNEESTKSKKDKSGMIDDFIEELINTGIIKDPNNIEEEIQEAIFNTVKAQIALKLKKKE